MTAATNTNNNNVTVRRGSALVPAPQFRDSTNIQMYLPFAVLGAVMEDLSLEGAVYAAHCLRFGLAPVKFYDLARDGPAPLKKVRFAEEVVVINDARALADESPEEESPSQKWLKLSDGYEFV